MAGGENTTGKSADELEVMSKEDSSWHPCQVSLCPSGIGLVVNYGSDGLDDMFVSEEETLARLRVRSNPLQGDDCIHIKQGEHVLAAKNLNSFFFDAEIDKVVKVRHSKKVQCRCTFVVKWLQGDPKEGTQAVPSSSIMKLAKESINDHPTISAFFHAVRTTSPLPTVGIDMDSELDLHELLGKQIEEINHSADTSKKSIAEDILLGLQVHTKGQIQCRPVTVSVSPKSQSHVTHDENHPRRSSRKSTRLQAETKVKDPPTLVQATQEELPENKSPVNPLAARAALASLMSKLPKNLEISFNQEGEKNFCNSLDITSHKHFGAESLNATEYISSSVASSFSMSATFFSQTEDASFEPKCDNVVKSLFSNRCALDTPQPLDVSSTRWTEDCKKGNKTSQFTNSEIRSHSIGHKNTSHPRKATRLRSAAVQNVADTSIDNTGNKQIPLKQSRRFTRSTVHNEEEIETIGTEEAITENIFKCDADTDTLDQNDMARESYALKDKVSIRSSLETDTKSASTKAPKSLKKVGGRKKKNDFESMTCVSEIKNIGRLTRSAIHKDIENTNVGNNQRLVEQKVPTNKDSSGGNVGPSVTAPSIHTEISLPLTEERNQKRKASSAFKTTQETEGNAFSDDGNSQEPKVLKRKSTSSRKQEVRFSPRLRFLPRTRLQHKS